jgi:hypothetical protein
MLDYGAEGLTVTKPGTDDVWRAQHGPPVIFVEPHALARDTTSTGLGNLRDLLFNLPHHGLKWVLSQVAIVAVSYCQLDCVSSTRLLTRVVMQVLELKCMPDKLRDEIIESFELQAEPERKKTKKKKTMKFGNFSTQFIIPLCRRYRAWVTCAYWWTLLQQWYRIPMDEFQVMAGVTLYDFDTWQANEDYHVVENVEPASRHAALFPRIDKIAEREKYGDWYASAKVWAAVKQMLEGFNCPILKEYRYVASIVPLEFWMLLATTLSMRRFDSNGEIQGGIGIKRDNPWSTGFVPVPFWLPPKPDEDEELESWTVQDEKHLDHTRALGYGPLASKFASLKGQTAQYRETVDVRAEAAQAGAALAVRSAWCVGVTVQFPLPVSRSNFELTGASRPLFHWKFGRVRIGRLCISEMRCWTHNATTGVGIASYLSPT